MMFKKLRPGFSLMAAASLNNNRIELLRFFELELISSIGRSANKAIRDAVRDGVAGNLDCKAIHLRSDFRILAEGYS